MIAQSMIVKVTLWVGLPQNYNIISVTLLVDTFLESLIIFFWYRVHGFHVVSDIVIWIKWSNKKPFIYFYCERSRRLVQKYALFELLIKKSCFPEVLNHVCCYLVFKDLEFQILTIWCLNFVIRCACKLIIPNQLVSGASLCDDWLLQY